MIKIDLSVVVCCFNSEKLIEDTLKHLVKQKLKANLVFEVVLVNNNSTDDIVNVAQTLWQNLKSDVPFRIIDEKCPGLAHARKKGALEAKGTYLVFCDDDNWLQEDYLALAYKLMSTHKEIGALGGQSVGILEIEEPRWWKSKCLGYAVGKQANNNGDISKRGFVWGAGMVMERSKLISLYEAGFNTLLLGRTGKVLSSGDDSEICKWMLLMGYKIWYSDELKFVHYIKKERLTDEYVERLFAGHANSQDILSVYNWFIGTKIQRFIGNLTIKNRFYLFKKVLRSIVKGNRQWKYYLQIILGTNIKVFATVYYISRTLKKLRQ